MRRPIQNTALLVASLIVAVILLEIGLRLLTPFPVTTTTNRIEHSRLGYTLSPALADVDERGFRNTGQKLEDADLAIIGDSHVYGNNVTSEDSFPAILASETGRNVYNLGVGSYGIYQYKVLMDDMLQYSIRDVILALYPANDLVFHCEVLNTEYWRSYIKDTGLSVPDCKDRNGPDQKTTMRGMLKRFLLGTATVQIILDLRRRMVDLDTDLGRILNEEAYWFDENQFVSKEQVRDHALATSLEDPDVRTNFENSQKFLIEGKQKLASASVGLVVVIIPSKEQVLYEWMAGRGRDGPAEFARFVKNEIFLTSEYISFFEKNDIAYVDALPDVVSALDNTLKEGGKFYKNWDGHPYRRGYEAYSKAAIRALERKATN